MKNIIGIGLLFIGILGYLYGWICGQKEQVKRVDELLIFLQKTIFAMKTQKVLMIEHFKSYESNDLVLEDTLKEIARRLELNIYPEGVVVWEEVIEEKRGDWNFDEETLWLLRRVGNGFFGACLEENVCFLQKNIEDLLIKKEELIEKNKKERKVWVPVGVLGGIMLVIIMI